MVDKLYSHEKDRLSIDPAVHVKNGAAAAHVLDCVHLDRQHKKHR